ncbi:Mitochondrial sodium/hydrogen exchanger 9B2 [Hypsibius exemplaris]|uniref:Mitochondrial sodium/hydrogen exchanger 9B2 n=1 Tax=Hypsibius exemplaris TaxID=2072580 RepID=A0A1W0X721_HYPEX|nr:Mitochondrial sodium/hydrogen exchanger 9B2 [Hypsibius exemplaris]
MFETLQYLHLSNTELRPAHWYEGNHKYPEGNTAESSSLSHRVLRQFTSTLIETHEIQRMLPKSNGNPQPTVIAMQPIDWRRTNVDNGQREARNGGFVRRWTNALMLKNSPPIENPTCVQRFRRALLCPPHGSLAYNLTKIIAIIALFLAFIAILKAEALPGGNFWGLLVVTVCAMVGEEIAKKLRLPGLLGMLVAGFLLQNVPGIRAATSITPAWSSSLRSIALVIILLRAGLGLDIVVLRRLSKSVASVAFVPSTIESCAVAVASHFILGFDWLWSFVLGYLLTAVSPAVLVPSMLALQENGLGVDKGVPTLLVAASSIENVYAIEVFSVLMSVGFSTTSLTMQILQAPIEIVIGVSYGLATGVLFWFFPHNGHPSKSAYRFIILLGAGLTAVFGGNALKYSGAGPLATLIMAFIAGYEWRKSDAPSHKEVAEKLAKLWRYFQPVLFGLIGAAVSIEKIRPETVGLGIAVIFIGVLVRFFVTPFATLGANLNWKEKMFASIAWFPKATVQATLGSKVYDYTTLVLSTQTVPDPYLLRVQQIGIQMLTIAVLCIVITAPLGALGITFTQNRLLQKKKPTELEVSEREFIEEELSGGKDNMVDSLFPRNLPKKRHSEPNMRMFPDEFTFT